MPPIQRTDPYGGFNFEVTVLGIADDGQAVGARFTEVSGIDSEVGVIEYRTGADTLSMIKLPGINKHSNITFKSGATGSTQFWNWIAAAMRGEIRRANGSITLLDENRDEVMRWNFTRAWPTKYTGPGFNAGNNEVAMETFEIAVETLELEV